MACSGRFPAIGALAQLVERLVRNEKVSGSNPLCSTSLRQGWGRRAGALGKAANHARLMAGFGQKRGGLELCLDHDLARDGIPDARSGRVALACGVACAGGG